MEALITTAHDGDPLTLLGKGSSLLRATWRNLYIARWYGGCTRVELELILGDLARLKDERGKVVVATLLDRGCSPPNRDTQQLAAGHQALMAPHMKAMATLVDGQGFWASVALTTLLSVKMARAAHPNEQVFRNMEDAAKWLVEFIQGTPSVRTIQDIFADCREGRIGGG